MSLHNKALVVTLSLGMPPQSKTLRGESDKLASEHRAEVNQAVVVAKLFAKADLRGLQRVSSEVRNWFKEKTLPYGRGQGLIPATQYFTFMQDLGTFRLRFNEAKQDLIDNIEVILSNAQSVSGTLFDRANYPSLNELDSSIYFSIECNPVPAANDYDKLADLTPEELEVLKREAVVNAQSKVNVAIQDLFKRLLKSVSHAAERLKDDDGGAKIFHNTLIGNINKAVDAAETLNVEDDDELKRLTAMVKDIFDGINPDELRRDADLRRNTAAKAEEIASKISELF